MTAREDDLLEPEEPPRPDDDDPGDDRGDDGVTPEEHIGLTPPD